MLAAALLISSQYYLTDPSHHGRNHDSFTLAVTPPSRNNG